MFNVSRLKGFSSEEKIACLLFFCCPIFYLTLQGWTNAFFFIIFLLASMAIAADPRRYIGGIDRHTWLVLIIFLMPFFAELIAQLGRQTLLLRSLDSPSRFLGGAFVVIYLFRSKISKEMFFLFCVGAWIACAVTFVTVIFNQEYFWSPVRAATYFVDPNNLGFNILLLLICSTYLVLSSDWRLWSKACLSLSVILGVSVLIMSGSRTSWFAFLAALELLILVTLWRNRSVLFVMHFILICSLGLLWEFSEPVSQRLLELFVEFRNIGQTSDSTSAGFRFKLFLLDIELLKHHYLFGLADGSLPEFAELKSYISWLEYDDYNMMVVAGTHSEFMAQFVRKGVVLGFAAVASTVLYPIWFFARRLRSPLRPDRGLALVAIMILSTLFVSGWAIEFLNIKMNASFLSIFFALAYSSFLAERRKDYEFIQKSP